MRIVVANVECPHNRQICDSVSKVWNAHPLRKASLREGWREVEVIVGPNKGSYLRSGDDFRMHWGDYPQVWLEIPYLDPATVPRFEEKIHHEFGHFIDRHDPDFTGPRSPTELTEIIGELGVYVRSALYTYWDMYIDGRLARRGVVVSTFEERQEDFLGSRPIDALDSEEAANLDYVWSTDAISFQHLLERALRHPKRRSRPEWAKEWLRKGRR